MGAVAYSVRQQQGTLVYCCSQTVGQGVIAASVKEQTQLSSGWFLSDYAFWCALNS